MPKTADALAALYAKVQRTKAPKTLSLTGKVHRALGWVVLIALLGATWTSRQGTQFYKKLPGHTVAVTVAVAAALVASAAA